MSGRLFIAHRKLAFHVFGSGWSMPGWYFPIYRQTETDCGNKHNKCIDLCKLSSNDAWVIMEKEKSKPEQCHIWSVFVLNMHTPSCQPDYNDLIKSKCTVRTDEDER